MSHRDQGLGQEVSVNHRSLREAIDWLLSPEVFSNISFRKGCRWTALTLVATALLWTWGSSKNVTERFVAARKIIRKAFRLQKELPSYQAFMKILRKWSCALLLAVRAHFQAQMERELPDHFRVAGFVVMAVDGSRIDLPRTESNQEQFSAGRTTRSRSSKRRAATTPATTNQKTAAPTAKKKASRKKSTKKQQAGQKRAAKGQKRAVKKKAATAKKSRRSCNDNPQMWVTMMWHVGTSLIWDWRSGPGDSSEREHLLSMIDGLPANSLVTADAGFVGYEYWKALIDSGRHFVIRVGANVRLLKDLGYVRRRKNIVYLWPDAAARTKQEPLVLRLTQFQTTKQMGYVVSDILDEKQLSDAPMVEIYKRRWGVEVSQAECTSSALLYQLAA